MKRKVGRLSAIEVKTLSKVPGMHPDGGGLYLQVSRAGVPSWIFRYSVGERRERHMGLGPYHTVSLKKAREKALECRNLRLDGIDPIEYRKAARVQALLETARVMTFKECAQTYIAAHRDSWRNPKHAKQWPATLERYVYPVFGDLPVQAIDIDLIVRVLEPIWKTKNETASRVRGRIEAVLNWATVRKFRHGDNPARWRGHLEELLAKKSAVAHHAALAYAEVPAFMTMLREQDGLAARALQFAILVAGRTNEVLGARWAEIDLEGRLWAIPGERMKAGREHRVPLSDASAAILGPLPRVSEFVFPGARTGRPLSNMAMTMVLRRMERGDLTVHGFRSTFRDWCAERTNFPHEVAEMALAHAVGDKVEAAYRRGDLFDKRRGLAEAWSRYCMMPAPAGEVLMVPRAG